MKTKSLFTIEDQIQNKSRLFELLNPQTLDPNKENLLIITYKNFADDFNYVYGFNHEIINLLKKKYNVIYAGKELRENVAHMENFYLINNNGYGYINKYEFKRKKEDPNSLIHNRSVLWKEFENAFGDLKIDLVFYASSEYAILPYNKSYHKEFAKMQNELHDYVGTDEQKIERIKEVTKLINSEYDNHVSILMFSAWHKNVMMNLPVFLHEKHPIKRVLSFSVDPANTYNYLEYYGIQCSNFYFEDDKRGTRNFKKFPIAHLQHLIYENRKEPTTNYSLEKTQDFFFMGTILQEKGSRMEMWYEFLSKLRLDNSKLWVPIKHNGIFRTKKQETSGHTKKGLGVLEERFSEIKNDIINHPNFSGHLIPNEIKRNIVSFKYSLVLRCVSIYDSLNFRPVFYTYLDILPFLDHQYDPDYLQIPKKFQDKLVVRSAEDIETRVAYYNQHPEERIQLLKELREFFEIDEFMKDWENITNDYLEI